MTLEDACHRYYNVIYRHCLKELYYNEEAAKDATQETFAAFCRCWDKLDHDKYEPWLWKTADNYINKEKARYTKNKIMLSEPDDIYPDPSTEPDMVEQILSKKIEERIDQYHDEVIRQLTEKDLKLLDFLKRKMKYADIAREIGSTPAAVSMAVVRLNRKVKEIVRKITEKIL